ncbi:hypothetical protein F4782DRAFT_494796 [Xylaria castorea]|nr:hypothetical protein F4782DRAFT_494796 [Xylaria castorea]
MIWYIFAIFILVGIELLEDRTHRKKVATAIAGANTTATTTTATTTVTVTNTQASAQSRAHTTDLPQELQGCDFNLLCGGASALEPPFDVADSVNLRQWQAAWRQLSELTRLIDINRGLFIYRHGIKEVKNFRVDLETLVEKPLRYGCSTLQHLQVGLLEFKDVDINQDVELRVILSNILRETEISIINNTLGATITHLLPSWARQAPELRSERCPGQDCFKIGETALDIAMLQIPIELINGVRRVQSNTAIGGTYAMKRAGSPAFGTMTPWGRVTTALVPDLHFSDVNSEQWITHITILGALIVFILFVRRARQRLGLLWLVGLSLVIIAVSWPYFGLGSLTLGHLNTNNYSFGRRH